MRKLSPDERATFFLSLHHFKNAFNELPNDSKITFAEIVTGISNLSFGLSKKSTKRLLTGFKVVVTTASSNSTMTFCGDGLIREKKPSTVAVPYLETTCIENVHSASSPVWPSSL